MFHVYMLASEVFPGQRYTGFTADVAARLKAHNKGDSPHTSKYLKSGSGKAFANKRLW